MMIHDDYYENYGVEYIKIEHINVGIAGEGNDMRIHLEAFPLKGWGRNVTYHERLKQSYYEVKEFWTSLSKQ